MDTVDSPNKMSVYAHTWVQWTVQTQCQSVHTHGYSGQSKQNVSLCTHMGTVASPNLKSQPKYPSPLPPQLLIIGCIKIPNTILVVIQTHDKKCDKL
jgi:hypothetical protein